MTCAGAYFYKGTVVMALAYLCSQPCGLGQDDTAAHKAGEEGMQRCSNEAAFLCIQDIFAKKG